MAPWDEVHRMRAILDVVLLILSLYTWIIIASAVLSWLLAFNVINYSNSVVRSIWNTIQALTEPLLQPIRNRLPRMGAIDLAPIVLLIGIFFLERVIVYYVYPSVF
jgi:YggT family protein